MYSNFSFIKVAGYLFLFYFISSGLNFKVNASSTVTPDAEVSAYIFMDRGENVHDRISAVCAEPKYACIDFSLANLEDADLDFVFNGLVAREKRVESAGSRVCGLKLIDIVCNDITAEGLLSFLTKLQNGQEEADKKYYPDVRETVVKIGFSLTEEYLERLRQEVPSVLSGGLRLVD